MSGVHLLRHARFSGCGAKLAPGLLERALCGLEQPAFPELLVGFGTRDDAGVWRLDDETALVQTVDFFPPIVDDPFTFGRIAAANALSDVYAMGGRPLTALAVACFPDEALDVGVLREMLRGGLAALAEAEAALVGGHSIRDETVKLGFAVTGLVHPKRFLRNDAARPGDALILTKALGTGILNVAMREGAAPAAAVAAAVASMTTLNRAAAGIAVDLGASACTDVTGFGLLGHAAEMVAQAPVGLRIDFARLPLLPQALDLARAGHVPGGTGRNRDFRRALVRGHDDLPPHVSDILFDPQTSGGLLFAVPPARVEEAVRRLRAEGLPAAGIGEVTTDAGRITVTP